jgi:2-aminoadipate transaminase
MARQAGVAVVESDIYSELRYEGEALPPLKTLDESGDGILLGSFSKIAFPGLRVGWVLGPRAVTARLAEAKQWSDLHSCQLAQAVLLRFLESGALEAHKVRVIEAGRIRRDAAVQACAREFPEGVAFTRPRGGMNLWIELPEWMEADTLLARAQTEGVVFLPGRYFAVSRPHTRCLRLSFAGLEPGKIRRGIEILGGIVKEEFQRGHGSERFEQPVALV